MNRILLSLILILGLTSCSHLSKKDKMNFAILTFAQSSDYVSTSKFLKKNNKNYINNIWSWKYSSNRPSDLELALVKAGELGIAYITISILPEKYRSYILFTGTGLLLYCTIGNERRFP